MNIKSNPCDFCWYFSIARIIFAWNLVLNKKIYTLHYQVLLKYIWKLQNYAFQVPRQPPSESGQPSALQGMSGWNSFTKTAVIVFMLSRITFLWTKTLECELRPFCTLSQDMLSKDAHCILVHLAEKSSSQPIFNGANEPQFLSEAYQNFTKFAQDTDHHRRFTSERSQESGSKLTRVENQDYIYDVFTTLNLEQKWTKSLNLSSKNIVLIQPLIGLYFWRGKGGGKEGARRAWRLF